jgi:hypothetical protein
VRRYVGVGVFLLWVTVGAGRAGAHFEETVASSRQIGMGGAVVSVAADATGAVINPAVLVQVYRWSALSTYRQPYGVGDLDEAFAAAALRLEGLGAAGIAVHPVGLRGVMSESVVTLALARDVIRTSEDASLSVGVSLDYARVSVSDRVDASAGVLTGGAGVLLRPFPGIGVAYAVRNLREGAFDLADGGGKTTLERGQSWGLSYLWHRRVTVSYQRRDDGGRWRDHLGVEVDMGPYLDLRTGLGRGSATGGVGVSWKAITLDAGFSSHEFMGSSYVVTVGYTPPAPANPYAQTP